MKLRNRLSKTFSLASLSLSALLAAPAIADDIDAYLIKKPSVDQPVHSLLFVLDESGSMRYDDATGRPRMDSLKEAMTELLQSNLLDNVKVAVMGYTTDDNPRFYNYQMRPLGDFARPISPHSGFGAYRDYLISQINNLQPTGFTPTGPALYYAAKWFTDGYPSGETGIGYKGLNHILPSGFTGNSPFEKKNYCADNQIILLTDGSPNYGIKPEYWYKNRRHVYSSIKLSLNDVNGADGGPTGNFTRPPERTYNTDIYSGLLYPASQRSAYEMQFYHPNNSEDGYPNDYRASYQGVNAEYIDARFNGYSSTPPLEEAIAQKMLAGKYDYCSPYSATDPFMNGIGPVSGRLRSLDSRSSICMADMAKFISETDLRTGTDYPNDQKIRVNTIGFAITNGSIEDQFLRSIAAAGHGEAYLTDNKEDLLAALANITSGLSGGAEYAFNSPSIPVDLSDPTASIDTIFLPLFRPSTHKIWVGNAKKYSFSQDGTELIIKGKGGTPVLVEDPDNPTGPKIFNQEETDLWSTNDSPKDGVDFGGAASRINASHDRTIYTQTEDGTLVKLEDSTATQINQAGLFDSTLMTENVVCPASGTTTATCLSASDLDRYASFLTDKDTQTSTYLSESFTDGKFSAINLTLPSFARKVKPDTIKIIADVDHLPTGGYDITITRSDADTASTTQVFNSISLGDETYLSMQINPATGTPYQVSSIQISCITAPCATDGFGIAEIEVLEDPLASGDIEWFTKTPLPANLEQSVDDGNGATKTITVTKMGAPIHTKPLLVKYEGSTSTADEVVILPTSEGVLHAFDAATGEELWGFMPRELLGNIGVLRNNTALSNDETPEYGLDGQPTYYTLNNGTQKVVAFGMRRGGKSYYALDITDRTNPELLWTINQTTPGFLGLGQTWARPIPAPIKLNGSYQPALVFGGGYDPESDLRTQHDGPSGWNEDTVGNRIYFVHAETGKPLIVITNNASENVPAGTIKVHLEELKNGIVAEPAKTRVFARRPVNGKNVYDRFYFAGTGGQLFRVDVDPRSNRRGADPVRAHTLATLGGDGPENYVRFFNKPAIGIGYKGRRITIGIGSGNRADLLDKSAQDRFYAINDVRTYRRVFNGHLITEAGELYDATDNALQPDGSNTTTDEYKTELEALKSKNGWFIKLPHIGEKVVSDALLLEGVLYFNTYEQTVDGDTDQDPCKIAKVSTSMTRFYALNMKDGTARWSHFSPEGNVVSDPSNPSSTIDLPVTRDRYRETPASGGGIPGNPFIMTDQLISNPDDTSPGGGNSNSNGQNCGPGTYKVYSSVGTEPVCVDINNAIKGISWEEILE